MNEPGILDALRGSRLAAELSDSASALAGRAPCISRSAVRRGTGTGRDVGRSSVRNRPRCTRSRSKRGHIREASSCSRLSAGDLVGELSFLDETPHYAALVAIGPTRVFGLERAKLEALLRPDPELVYRVMRAIFAPCTKFSDGSRCSRSSSRTTSTSSTGDISVVYRPPADLRPITQRLTSCWYVSRSA